MKVIKIENFCIPAEDADYDELADFADRIAVLATDVIEVEPVRRGRWVIDDIDKYKCFLCGKGNNYAYSWSIGKGDELQDLYCPHCGAKMEV